MVMGTGRSEKIYGGTTMTMASPLIPVKMITDYIMEGPTMPV